MNQLALACGVGCLLMTCFNAGLAQDVPEDNEAVGDLLAGVLPPESPALFALGVTGLEITRPESPAALALSVLNGLDPRGNFQTGMAFDFVPYLMIAGDELTLRDYRSQTVKRQWSRIQASAAATKGATDDDEAARAALGLRWTPVDTGDRFLAEKLSDCLVELGERVLRSVPDDILDPVERLRRIEERREELQPEFEECRRDNAPRLTQSTSLQLSLAPVFVSESGETSDFESQGFSSSVSWAAGFNWLLKEAPPGVLLLGANYRKDEVVPDPDDDDKFFEQDKLGLGGRVIFGNFTSYFLGFEGVYEITDRSGRASEDSFRYTASSDLHLTGGVWLSLSIGGSSGVDEGDEIFALSRLRWNFSSEPKLSELLE